MPKVKVPLTVSNTSTLEDLRRFISETVGPLVDEFNGRVSMTENVQTSTLTFEFPGAGQNVGVAHGLGFIPTGFITIKNSNGIVPYDGNATNTNDTFYLRATGAGTVTVLVF